MTVPFMRAYTELLVRTCHRRGAHAIGGMAAFIPNRRDPAVTERALAQGPRRQGAREPATGSTGRGSPIPTSCRSRWRSSTASSATGPNQKERTARGGRGHAPRSCSTSTVAGGAVTEAGVRANVRVALAYLDSWLRGVGAAAIDNLMEDAATAEISRSQLWLWSTQAVVARRRASRSTPERYAAIRDEELARLGGAGEGRLAEAADLLDRLVLDDDFAEFLTLRAYAILE